MTVNQRKILEKLRFSSIHEHADDFVWWGTVDKVDSDDLMALLKKGYVTRPRDDFIITHEGSAALDAVLSEALDKENECTETDEA